MNWVAENWLCVMLLVLFLGMHLFGHGCHGGHKGRHPEHDGERVHDAGKERAAHGWH